MRLYNENERLNTLQIEPHNIIITWTSEVDYEMSRMILLNGIKGLEWYDEYLLLEGGHCSCYDFDETEWHAMVYTKEELLKLADANYNELQRFWQMVKEYFG